MDPFTALSPACGIIQVVDFSTKAVTKCRELYKDGSSSENEDFEEMANHLLSLRASLDVPNQRSQDKLQELAGKCSDTAEDLIKELRKLKTNRSRKKLEVASKAFKTLWKKEAIEEIWKRLCQYRNILDTHILVDLRYANFNIALNSRIQVPNMTVFAFRFVPYSNRKLHMSSLHFLRSSAGPYEYS